MATLYSTFHSSKTEVVLLPKTESMEIEQELE